MANGFEVIGGLILIGFTFTLLIFATPAVSDATNTAPGHSQENLTGTDKDSMDLTHSVAILLPAIFFFVGFVIVLKGLFA